MDAYHTMINQTQIVVASGQADLLDAVALAIGAAAQPMFEANSQLLELDLYSLSAVSMQGMGGKLFMRHSQWRALVNLTNRAPLQRLGGAVRLIFAGSVCVPQRRWHHGINSWSHGLLAATPPRDVHASRHG